MKLKPILNFINMKKLIILFVALFTFSALVTSCTEVEEPQHNVVADPHADEDLDNEDPS